MRSKVIRLLAILLFLLPLLTCTPAETALVTEVIDGDTITIDSGHRVRYIGIDTPELASREIGASEAWLANRKLVEGKKVRLERDISETDRYGRLLRYVYVNDTFVNAELVKMGLAEAKAYPPDTKYQDYFKELERSARKANRGIWAYRK